MRGLALLAIGVLAFGQAPDPAYETLARSYEALRAADYDAAIAGFLRAIESAPARPSIRKDLAYAYLKIGENILAREQFKAVMEIDGADAHAALEYAFLCYETKERQQARRVFDRIRKQAAEPDRSAAEKAFQQIDGPLAQGIGRWREAIAAGGSSFSAHFELAGLAEDRDELQLAAEHYEKAWRLRPERRTVLVDLGRVLKALGREEAANAALLAASRSSSARAAEGAREMLPNRYPYVAEFRRALDLDPTNAMLRRDLAYLLLTMGRQPQAEAEFERLTETTPDDLLSATQLGFLLHARGETARAQKLFDRVLTGSDPELANRVRAVLRKPQVEAPDRAPAVSAREMAERSIKAGYMKDAARYLEIAQQLEPSDEVALKLGWTYNILRQDDEAVKWFDVARGSSNPLIAAEARKPYRNLLSATKRFATSAWILPTFSSRHQDVFVYGQIKGELRTGIGLRPYASVRFVGNTRGALGDVSPRYLSEESLILGVGVRTPVWRGLMGWAEAGSAVSYREKRALSDYRGGISGAWAAGTHSGAEGGGWFRDTAIDGVFISRFGNNFLVYEQGRIGYAMRPLGRDIQVYVNGNITVDVRRQWWANFAEAGPGIRLTGKPLPDGMYLTVNVLRGAHLINDRRFYNNVRVGIWYAFTR